MAFKIALFKRLGLAFKKWTPGWLFYKIGSTKFVSWTVAPIKVTSIVCSLYDGGDDNDDDNDDDRDEDDNDDEYWR